MKTFNENDLLTVWQQLKQFNSTPDHQGLTRLAYSPEDELAMTYIHDILVKCGLEIRQDSLGNLFARLPGLDRQLPAIGTGSHLDSVPQGGHYDGIIGVMAGLYALCQFKPGQLKRDLELVIFRCEESSRFGISCLGSKALIGEIDYINWQVCKDNSGYNLFQAAELAGYKTDQLASCRLPDNYFSAFVEVHIEQGQCLEINNKSIGIVTGIAAPTRYRIDIQGHAAHSGATPMHYRHDALVAAASIITEVNRLALDESIYGTVGTVGKLDVTPNSMNVIPGYVQLFIDIRGIDIESIERLNTQLSSYLISINTQWNVNVSTERLSHETPIKLNLNIQETIEEICQDNHIKYMHLPSGAGHDAMNMAKQFPTGMIFIPSKDGVSHHHAEYSSWDDVMLSAKLLTQTVEKLANQ